MSDGSLVERDGALELKSEREFDRELERSLPRLRAHLARRGGDVDDLAQEAAARALRSRGRFDGARGLWPWLRRIAERVRIDHGRRAAEAPAASDTLDPVDARAHGREHDGSEARAAAERIVAGLPPRARDVLLRFHVEGQSVAAIAAALALPVGTVKSELSRARRRLAEWHGSTTTDGSPGDDATERSELDG